MRITQGKKEQLGFIGLDDSRCQKELGTLEFHLIDDFFMHKTFKKELSSIHSGNFDVFFCVKRLYIFVPVAWFICDTKTSER